MSDLQATEIVEIVKIVISTKKEVNFTEKSCRKNSKKKKLILHFIVLV
jgi:hypothetical protein